MKDNLLIQWFKELNRKLLLTTIVLLIGMIAATFILWPWIYNAFFGPFEITYDELLQISKEYKENPPEKSYGGKKIRNPFLYDYYKRNKEFSFEISNIQNDISQVSWTTHEIMQEHSRLTKALRVNPNPIKITKVTYVVNDKILMSKDIGLLTGVLIPAQEKGKDSVLQLECVSGTVTPAGLDAYHVKSDDILNLYFFNSNGISYIRIFTDILPVLFIICIRNFIVYFRRRKNAYWHPAMKKVNDLEQLEQDLEENPVVDKKTITTEHWIIQRKRFTLLISRRYRIGP